ncbi:MAG: TetR/AcrR family transcriptional regulator [Deltaproteobacteria bacterium]|nr:TetR/AcrR family transcriptional regulator [Deltaproteobacteria bacterium]
MKTNNERSALTRSQILKKSMELFVLQGYHNTSIRDIAKESKISTGAIYHYFSGKEEIAAELFNSTVLCLNNLFIDIINSKKTTENKIKDFVFNILGVAEDDEIMMKYALDVKHEEIIKDGRPICSSGPFELLRTFLKNEMEKGNIKKMDSYVATVCLTGIPIRLIKIKWDGVINDEISNFKDIIFEAVWKTLKA